MCRAVWHTHTVGFPTLAAEGDEVASTAAAARTRHAFSPRDTPVCPHTALTAAHGPPCAAHDRHRDTCNTPTTAPPAPHVAPHTWGDLRPCMLSHPLPAHGANAQFRVGSAPQRAQPLAWPFCRTALVSRSVPTASCAMHSTPLVQDLQRHTTHLRSGPRPLATRPDL